MGSAIYGKNLHPQKNKFFKSILQCRREVKMEMVELLPQKVHLYTKLDQSDIFIFQYTMIL